MQHRAGTGVDRDGKTAGDGVVDGEVLAFEHAVLGALALGDFDQDRLDPVLAALRRHQRERELRPDDRNVGAQLEQKRDRTDVVFVCVGDDDRLDLVEPMLDVTQIRQDQVDAGFVVCREQHTAIDDQQPS